MPVREATLPLTSESDVARVRLIARDLGRSLDLVDTMATRFATAVSEVARNAVVHAGGGTIAFSLETNGRAASVVATVSDAGPGIADLDAALRPRGGGPTQPGLGLSRARRLVDDLRIRTGAGEGTEIAIVRSIPAAAAARWPEAIGRIAGTSEASGRAGDSGSGSVPGAAGAAAPPATPPAARDGAVVPGPVAPEAANPDPAGTTAAELARARDEIARLRDEAARLEREIEETNRGVVALYAELEDQAERLRRADETKSRFLSRVSHELRTPINSVVALARLLHERVDGELTAGQETQVDFIRKAADELAVLVNDLLDLARIESGRVDVFAHEFLLASVFAGLRGTLRPLITRPEVSLVFEGADDVPPLLTDEGKLAQIIRNFVSNALKFTNRGRVVVAASFQPETRLLRITVTDTGVGIAADDLERIFDEFTQVAGAHQIGVRGTGLGLPVSRGLAELLGGTVGVTSRVGEGSTFWVEIPAIYSAPPAAETDADGPPSAATTILVIDDDPVARYLTRHALATEGYRILESTAGRSGLERAREERPDAIILDLSMPDLDGSLVLDELRADTTTAAIPVVIHTGRDLEEGEERALRQEADSIVSKSDPPAAIAAVLREVLDGSRSPREGQP